MYLLFVCCIDDLGYFYDPELVVWSHDLDHLKNVGNQWVAECKDDSVKQYSIRLVKPEGLTELIYCSPKYE